MSDRLAISANLRKKGATLLIINRPIDYGQERVELFHIEFWDTFTQHLLKVDVFDGDGLAQFINRIEGSSVLSKYFAVGNRVELSLKIRMAVDLRPCQSLFLVKFKTSLY